MLPSESELIVRMNDICCISFASGEFQESQFSYNLISIPATKGVFLVPQNAERHDTSHDDTDVTVRYSPFSSCRNFYFPDSQVTQGVTASYPAAASNHAPVPPHITSQKQRGYRICDQCGAVENPSTSRFRLCGGCVRASCLCSVGRAELAYFSSIHQYITQYCSRECQKGHWSSHKPICQHTFQLAGPKKPAVGPDKDDMGTHLRKFTSLYSTLLGWAAFQALRLKRMPVNVRTCALLIELSCNNDADPNRR
jgi:hypothetical protein